MAGITSHFGDPIKQYPGEVQVLWRVRVQAPGKHFNGLRGAEVSAKYWVSAVEYRERYSFERHQKGWGAAHTGPGISVCAGEVDGPCPTLSRHQGPHYNWKYSFLRPSVEGIVKRYKEKFSSKSSRRPRPQPQLEFVSVRSRQTVA